MSTDSILSGLKVVDFASFVAAPGAAVMLSDFGADVIKVEPPSGDPQRLVYPVPPHPAAHDNDIDGSLATMGGIFADCSLGPLLHN